MRKTCEGANKSTVPVGTVNGNCTNVFSIMEGLRGRFVVVMAGVFETVLTWAEEEGKRGMALRQDCELMVSLGAASIEKQEVLLISCLEVVVEVYGEAITTSVERACGLGAVFMSKTVLCRPSFVRLAILAEAD